MHFSLHMIGMTSARRSARRVTDSLSRGRFQSLLRRSGEARGPEIGNGRDMKLVPAGDRQANCGDDRPASAVQQLSAGRTRTSDRALRKCSRSDAGQRRDRPRQQDWTRSDRCPGPLVKLLSTTSLENPQGERGQKTQPAGWPARITRPGNRSGCFASSSACNATPDGRILPKARRE